jgi:hypothetical protein
MAGRPYSVPHAGDYLIRTTVAVPVASNVAPFSVASCSKVQVTTSPRPVLFPHVFEEETGKEP